MALSDHVVFDLKPSGSLYLTLLDLHGGGAVSGKFMNLCFVQISVVEPGRGSDSVLGDGFLAPLSSIKAHEDCDKLYLNKTPKPQPPPNQTHVDLHDTASCVIIL